MRLLTSVLLVASLLPALAQAQDPDLTITKTHGGVGFSAGSTTATYSVIVKNIGAGNKVAGQVVTVTDTPPAGYTITAMSGGGWTCAILPTCTRADALPATGSYPTIAVVGTVALNAASPLVNTASVATTQTESDTTNNAATDSSAFVLLPDLTITKTHGGVGFTAGSTNATYSVNVTNIGMGGAVAGQVVTVTDTPPSGYTITAMSGTGWTCTILPTCTRSDTLPGGTAYPSIAVTGTVAPDAAISPLVNTISVATTQPESNTANNSATDSSAFVLRPDLRITKTHVGDFTAGSTGTYSVVVSNVGGIGADKLAGYEVSVTDTPPPGLTVTSMSGSGWTCTTLPTCTRSDVLATANSYPPIVVIVSVTLSSTSPKVNSVSVSSPFREPSLTDNTATDSTNIVGDPIAISKAFSPTSIAISSTSVITFIINNRNPALTMTNVAFTDNLPAGLIVSQAANATNTCGGAFTAASNATSVSLAGGTIAPNSTCQVQVTVQATTPGPKVNTTGAVTGVVNATPLTGNPATATLNVAASQVSFLIRYAANLNIGESVVNFTNTGESSTFSFGGNLAQNGEICANVFAYSPDEQLVSCCSCNVTPNALNSLSVKADLGTNTLTPIIPTSLVIKVVATQGGAACTASSAATVNTAILQPGLVAWGTSLHALPATPGSPAGTHGVAETPFSLGTISTAELTRMAQLCAFIRANGSGYGICKSCKVGGLGASAK